MMKNETAINLLIILAGITLTLCAISCMVRIATDVSVLEKESTETELIRNAIDDGRAVVMVVNETELAKAVQKVKEERK